MDIRRQAFSRRDQTETLPNFLAHRLLPVMAGPFGLSEERISFGAFGSMLERPCAPSAIRENIGPSFPPELGPFPAMGTLHFHEVAHAASNPD
jgi:hypothetical protein